MFFVRFMECNLLKSNLTFVPCQKSETLRCFFETRVTKVRLLGEKKMPLIRITIEVRITVTTKVMVHSCEIWFAFWAPGNSVVLRHSARKGSCSRKVNLLLYCGRFNCLKSAQYMPRKVFYLLSELFKWTSHHSWGTRSWINRKLTYIVQRGNLLYGSIKRWSLITAITLLWSIDCYFAQYALTPSCSIDQEIRSPNMGSLRLVH